MKISRQAGKTALTGDYFSRYCMVSPVRAFHLARVMLLEQLYRGAKLNAGERYHK